MSNDHPITYQEPESSRDEATIDLRQYWQVLMRFKAGIVGLGLLAAIVALLVAMGMTNIYQSTATLMIEQNQRNIVSIEEVYGIDSPSREYFSTQSELLKGRNLAERVIAELKLLEHPEFAPEDTGSGFGLGSLRAYLSSLLNSSPASSQPNEEQRLMATVRSTFSEKLSVAPVRDTDLVRITFESEDPLLAADVANSLANNYIEASLEQRLGASQQANVWLSDRMQSLKHDLDKSELRLQQFLERERLVDIEGVASLQTQELDELTTQSVEARRNREELEVVYRQIQQSVNPDPQELMNYPAILNHAAVQGIKTRGDEIAQQIAELSNRYGRNHPRMIALNAEQKTVQQDLARQVRQVLASIENDYQSALGREQSIARRLDESKVELQEINRKSFELRELEREVTTNQQLYDMFFTRFRETSETDDFQATQAIVVDPAVPAVEPSKPNRSLIVTISLAAGLMLGVLLAFVRDMLDNTIKTPAGIEERLNSKTLGLVPLIKEAKAANSKTGKGGKKRGYLGLLEDNQSPFSESVRTLRTGITLSSIDNPYTVIEVTSSVPDEGKSTVAVNLAAALNQLKRTLLIDADLRRPTLANTLGLPAHAKGLADYIAGNAKLNECVYRHKKTGLAIMSVGQVPPNPLELLSSQKFEQMLVELRRVYGHIVIDTPPTQAVSDALVVGRLSDATVYVVKADSTPVNVIKRGLQRLQESRTNLLGVVLNQVVTDKHSSYDYGGYYDTYGYGANPESA